jgi:hypothetical protein
VYAAMNCGLIQTPSLPGRGPAHSSITCLKAWSKLAVMPGFLSSFLRLRETCTPPMGMIDLGSGDHHVMG